MDNPPLRLLAASQSLTEQAPQWVLKVAGREMWLAAHSGERGVLLHVPDMNVRAHFDLRSAQQMQTLMGRPLPSWARPAAAALLALSEQNIALAPTVLVVVGDEPAGPRYEHALGMSLLMYALSQAGQEPQATELLSWMERAQKLLSK